VKESYSQLSSQVDMSREAEVEQLIQTAAPDPDGRLHVFVNNAARFVFGEVTEVTEEQWDAALSTNVKG
jgi:NAD(P)-dependent dehydrogenase (short-subunit alcohol dehydrogenase family)